MGTIASAAGAARPNWQELTARYQRPDALRSAWQICNSVIPYLAVWYLMYRSLAISWWVTLALAPLAAGFLVRTFIIFHDCGHGAFFRSGKASDIVGYITGVMTFTPYYRWRYDHAKHHATSGDLDRRDIGGEIWTLTVDEYLAAPRRTRIFYRIYRNPLILFGIGPLYLFLIAQRLPLSGERPRERASVWWTNLGVIAYNALLIVLAGWREYLLIQVPIMAVGGTAAVWLFYVQHQFETTYWERTDRWDYFTAALHGSSFYKLPRILQWFSGNIGFHHIHHLNSRIPNYRLQRCHQENPELAAVRPITLLSSLKSMGYRLWDERRRRMVGFGHLRQYRRAGAAAA